MIRCQAIIKLRILLKDNKMNEGTFNDPFWKQIHTFSFQQSLLSYSLVTKKSSLPFGRPSICLFLLSNTEKTISIYLVDNLEKNLEKKLTLPLDSHPESWPSRPKPKLIVSLKEQSQTQMGYKAQLKPTRRVVGEAKLEYSLGSKRQEKIIIFGNNQVLDEWIKLIQVRKKKQNESIASKRAQSADVKGDKPKITLGTESAYDPLPEVGRNQINSVRNTFGVQSHTTRKMGQISALRGPNVASNSGNQGKMQEQKAPSLGRNSKSLFSNPGSRNDKLQEHSLIESKDQNDFLLRESKKKYEKLIEARLKSQIPLSHEQIDNHRLPQIPKINNQVDLRQYSRPDPISPRHPPESTSKLPQPPQSRTISENMPFSKSSDQYSNPLVPPSISPKNSNLRSVHSPIQDQPVTPRRFSQHGPSNPLINQLRYNNQKNGNEKGNFSQESFQQHSTSYFTCNYTPANYFKIYNRFVADAMKTVENIVNRNFQYTQVTQKSFRGTSHLENHIVISFESKIGELESIFRSHEYLTRALMMKGIGSQQLGINSRDQSGSIAEIKDLKSPRNTKVGKPGQSRIYVPMACMVEYACHRALCIANPDYSSKQKVKYQTQEREFHMLEVATNLKFEPEASFIVYKIRVKDTEKILLNEIRILPPSIPYQCFLGKNYSFSFLFDKVKSLMGDLHRHIETRLKYVLEQIIEIDRCPIGSSTELKSQLEQRGIPMEIFLKVALVNKTEGSSHMENYFWRQLAINEGILRELLAIIDRQIDEILKSSRIDETLLVEKLYNMIQQLQSPRGSEYWTQAFEAFGLKYYTKVTSSISKGYIIGGILRNYGVRCRNVHEIQSSIQRETLDGFQSQGLVYYPFEGLSERIRAEFSEIEESFSSLSRLGSPLEDLNEKMLNILPMAIPVSSLMDIPFPIGGQVIMKAALRIPPPSAMYDILLQHPSSPPTGCTFSLYSSYLKWQIKNLYPQNDILLHFKKYIKSIDYWCPFTNVQVDLYHLLAMYYRQIGRGITAIQRGKEALSKAQLLFGGEFERPVSRRPSLITISAITIEQLYELGNTYMLMDEFPSALKVYSETKVRLLLLKKQKVDESNYILLCLKIGRLSLEAGKFTQCQEVVLEALSKFDFDYTYLKVDPIPTRFSRGEEQMTSLTSQDRQKLYLQLLQVLSRCYTVQNQLAKEILILKKAIRAQFRYYGQEELKKLLRIYFCGIFGTMKIYQIERLNLILQKIELLNGWEREYSQRAKGWGGESLISFGQRCLEMTSSSEWSNSNHMDEFMRMLECYIAIVGLSFFKGLLTLRAK